MKIVKHYWFVAIALITMISFSSSLIPQHYYKLNFLST